MYSIKNVELIINEMNVTVDYKGKEEIITLIKDDEYITIKTDIKEINNKDSLMELLRRIEEFNSEMED